MQCWKYQCQGQFFLIWSHSGGMPHSGEEVQDLPFRDDVSHGSIVMEFIWAFSTGNRCAIYGLKPFSWGPGKVMRPLGFSLLFFFFFAYSTGFESQNHAQCLNSLGGGQNEYRQSRNM